MEIINVGVDEFVSWVAGHGEHSFLMVTIFSLGGKSSAVCGKWGVKCLRRKKKGHLLQSLGKMRERDD